MPPKYKLTYFDARGSAEPARLLFAVAGVEYEDHRVSGEGWTAIKADQPFGQLPVLRIDGKPLPQSRAIFRYIAREYGLYGANPWESALIDIPIEVCDELAGSMLQNWKEKDAVRKEEGKKKLTEEQVPITLANLEKCLKYNNNGDGWFVGDKLSLADIIVWSLHERLTQHISENYLDNFPKLKSLIDRFKNQKEIAEWLAKRPVTEF